MRANDNWEMPGPQVMEEAADWVDRLDELSQAERLELDAWLRASTVHAAAFVSIRQAMLDTALLEAAERVRNNPEVPEPKSAPVRRARPARMGMIAAGLAAVIAVSTAVGLRMAGPGREAPIELATAVGGRSDYGLSDRSVVHLNADSHLTVQFSKASRDIRLHKGDAMFDVAKNPDRPFNVLAGGATVTAVGTSFEVDLVSDAVEVRVFEGVVKVAQPNAPQRMVRKGEWVLLSAGRPPTGGRFEPETYQTWRSDWLDAERTPLKYVVARLNRYSGDQVVLSSPEMGDLKVTGRFKLGQPGKAVEMISALLEVDAVRQGGRIYLSPRHPDPRRAGRTT